MVRLAPETVAGFVDVRCAPSWDAHRRVFVDRSMGSDWASLGFRVVIRGGDPGMTHDAERWRRRRRPRTTPGQPRSTADAEALARFDQRFALPLVLSAILPLVLAPGSTRSVLAAIVSTRRGGVFIVDFVVHERRLQHYLSTWLGRFDLSVVVLTAPWFLLFGPGDTKFVLVIRLSRIARLVMATKGARRLFERLGRVRSGRRTGARIRRRRRVRH